MALEKFIPKEIPTSDKLNKMVDEVNRNTEDINLALQGNINVAGDIRGMQSELSELSQKVEELGTAVDNKYEKPADGIPSTDLSTDLQTSISRADAIYDDYINSQSLM